MEMTYIWLASCILAQHGAPPTDQLQQIRALHEANRATMHQGVVAFQYETGRAGDLTRARAGDFTDSYSAQCRFLFADQDALIEVLYSPETLHAARRRVSENQYTSPLFCYRALTDGQLTLMDKINPRPDGIGVNHHPHTAPGDALFKYVRLPLNLGNPNPVVSSLSADLDSCIRGEIEFLSLDTEGFEGHQTLHLALKKAGGTTDYWIDLEKGAIPRKMLERVTVSGNVIEEYLDGIMENGVGGWFPWTYTTCLNGTSRVMRLHVTSAAFDLPPARSDFEMRFPTPLALLDKLRGERRPPRDVWSIRDLHLGSGQPLNRAIPPPVASTLPNEADSFPLWPIGIVMILSLAILIGLRLRRG